MAIVGFCYAPLQKFSERADEIHEAIAKEIETKKDTYPPGLYDQYVVQLDRLRRGGPGCEIVGVPGFYSYPSESVRMVHSNPDLTGCRPSKSWEKVLVSMRHVE